MRSGIWVVLALILALSASAVLAAPPTLGGGWYNSGYSYQPAPTPALSAPAVPTPVVPMGQMSSGCCGDASSGCCESVWDGYCETKGARKCGLKKFHGGHHARCLGWGGVPVWAEGCCGGEISSCCGNGGSVSSPTVAPSPNPPVGPAPTPAAPVPPAPKRATFIPAPNSSAYTY